MSKPDTHTVKPRKAYENSLDLLDGEMTAHNSGYDTVYVRCADMAIRRKCVHCPNTIMQGRTCKDNGGRCQWAYLTEAERMQLKAQGIRR